VRYPVEIKYPSLNPSSISRNTGTEPFGFNAEDHVHPCRTNSRALDSLLSKLFKSDCKRHKQCSWLDLEGDPSFCQQSKNLPCSWSGKTLKNNVLVICGAFQAHILSLPSQLKIGTATLERTQRKATKTDNYKVDPWPPGRNKINLAQDIQSHHRKAAPKRQRKLSRR